MRVMDATTSFKVLPQRLKDSEQPPSKKQRLELASSSLEESEYEYQVAHAMVLEGYDPEELGGKNEVSIEQARNSMAMHAFIVSIDPFRNHNNHTQVREYCHYNRPSQTHTPQI